MKYIKIIFFAIILFILVYFAHYNQKETILIFYQYGPVTCRTIPLPLFAFFYMAILITIIVMSVLGIAERTALRLKAKKLGKENEKLQRELDVFKGLETTSVSSSTPGPDETQVGKDGNKKGSNPRKKKQTDSGTPTG